MNSAAAIPDEARLRALLDGTLPEEEQAGLLALIEANPTWQQALDRLAAGAQTWQAAAAHLQAQPLAADAALRSAMAAVQAPTIASDQHSTDGSVKLDFLSPADDPRYLGQFGDFLVETVIGRGGFGIVLRAFDPPLRRIVALKVLAPHLASNMAACLRFAREAKAAAAVVHDHVITIHSVGDKPLPHLVMQYVAGQSLQEKLDRCGPLEIKEVLRIGMQTAAGLAAAHKHGEIHRDIKPANILLENGIERVKITDFGLARAADDASMTQSGVVAGTPQYMSPEQARGDTVDARSDLFSLGSVLYATCAGHPPFRATTTMGVLKRVCDDPPRPIREVNPEVPPWLAEIIDRLMAKNPADRFASAAEVSELLGQCLSHLQQPSAMPLPPVGPVCRTGPANSTDKEPQVPLGKRDLRSDDALLDHARRSVREPAIGLVIAGIVNVISLAIALLFLSNFLAHGIFTQARWLIPVIAAFGLTSGLMVLGGLKMMRLENRLLVSFAAVAALLVSPGCLVGFAMGLWALVVLSRRDVQRGFAIVARRHWPGVAEGPAELPEEGEWSCRCTTCGYVAPAHKWGIGRMGAASRGKWTILRCPNCRWFSWMSVERFTAKSLALQKPAPQEQAPASAQPSGGPGLVLFILFLVFAVPLTLLFAAGLGYFLMGSGSPPASTGTFSGPREVVGGLIYQNPDSQFEVVVHRFKTLDGEHVADGWTALRHNQLVNVPVGEYRAEVRSGGTGGIVVREDTFVVDADGVPTTYRVGAGGTLRFVAEPRDDNLVLVLNGITGQSVWEWPTRPSIALPDGLVHILLTRPAGKGGSHILANSYFDIVAGQETVIRVREKDIELVTEGIDLDPVVTAKRVKLETAQKRHEAGIATKLELIEAQLAYQQARLDRATRNDRQVLALSILEEIAALAAESEQIIAAIYERGSVPLQTLQEAKTASLKHQQRLQETMADLKSAGKLPADFELPHPHREILLKRFEPAAPDAAPSGADASAVAIEEGAWRIVNNAGQGNFRVPLASLQANVPEDGIVICRAKVKLKPSHELTWGQLELNEAGPQFFEFDWPREKSYFAGEIAEWKQLEVRYPAHLFIRKSPPEIPIGVVLAAGGTLWVKDLELRHLPETSAPPYRGEGEKIVRSFTFKDRPITQDSLFDSAHGWRYSVLEPTTVRLFELRDPQVEEGRLIFRCRMKSKDAAGASLSLRIRYPDGVEVRQAESQPNVAEGTTDWVTYAVSHALRKEMRPERVSLEVEMRGRQKDRPFGNEIWIKDVELLQAPAEPIASTTIADLPVPGFFMSRLHRSSDPENTWGYCPAVVMYLGSRPLVCFGVQQRPKEEGRYLYMILFKTGADYAASFGAGTDGHSNTDEAHHVATIELGDQKLEVVYDFQADKQTQKIVREALKINGEEVARGGPHVFLADLTQPVLTLKPIDVPLPAKIPDLADEDHSSWPQTLLTEVFKLSAKSPEIQEFLSTGPVQKPE